MTTKTVMVPVAYMYHHEDTGEIGFVDQQQLEWGFEKNNPRLQVIGPLYAAPQQAKAEWLPYPKYKPEDASVNPFCLCLVEGKHPVVGSYADNYDHFVYMGGSVSGNVTHFIQIPQPPEKPE